MKVEIIMMTRKTVRPLVGVVFLAGVAVAAFSTGSAAIRSISPTNPQPTPVRSSGPSQALAASEFKRLVQLSKALEKIPPEKVDREPHKSFIRTNRKDIVYSEPAGQWYVRSDRFWALSEKYKKLPIADDIAWAAAENPLPGECEGYINCYVSIARSTYGHYLSLYPNGKNSRKALLAIAERLSYIVDDLKANKGNYEGPVDSTDRAELAKAIADLRGIASKVTHSERSKVLSQLNVIGDRFK